LKYPGRVRQLTTDDVAKAAKKTVHPDSVQWVVVGDRAKIEPAIRELGFAEIHLIDADGNVLK
jgi:zinc protease